MSDGGTPWNLLRDRLLIQAPTHHADVAAGIAVVHGGGLVITGANAIEKAQQIRNNGFSGPILCDAEKYAGSKRRTARRGITVGWSDRQRQFSQVALTDSGFIEAGDTIGLRCVLTAAARQNDPTIAMLPLAQSWFRALPVARALAAEIVDHGVPVAIAIESDKDPLENQVVLDSFLHVLAVPVPVLALRTDVSGLGAVCHGALAAAIGTTTKYRHIFPIKIGGGPDKAPQVAAFLPHLLCYRSVDLIAAAVQEQPDEADVWQCECEECLGRSLDRLATIQNRSEQEIRAFRHSLHTLFALWRNLIVPGSTLDERQRSWHEHCQHARFGHTDLKHALGTRWRPPPVLKRWVEASPPPGASSVTP